MLRTDETARHGELQIVLLGVQAENARLDRSAAELALRVLGDHARSHFDLLANLYIRDSIKIPFTFD